MPLWKQSVSDAISQGGSERIKVFNWNDACCSRLLGLEASKKAVFAKIKYSIGNQND